MFSSLTNVHSALQQELARQFALRPRLLWFDFAPHSFLGLQLDNTLFCHLVESGTFGACLPTFFAVIIISIYS